jgi:hypothetical protein
VTPVKLWPPDQRGTLSAESARCALCGRSQTWETVFKAAHVARKWARVQGWTFIPPYGWVCRCRTMYPGALELEAQIARRCRRRPNPSRVQITLTIE